MIPIICMLLVCLAAIALRAIARDERIKLNERDIHKLAEERRASETLDRMVVAAQRVDGALGRIQGIERVLQDHDARLAASQFRRTS